MARAAWLVGCAVLVVLGGVARGQEENGKTAPKKSESSDIVGHASSEVSLYSDTDAVTVVTPTIAGSVENPISEWSIGGRYLVDVVSAASVDIVSTASRAWHEVRNEGDFDGSFKVGDLGVAASGSISREPDYLAWAVGGRLSYDFADKNVTATAGYAYGHDTIGRSDTPFSVFSHDVDRHTFNAAMNVVVNPSTLVSLVGDVILESGDQSKPYRYIPLFSAHEATKVPVGASIDFVNAQRLPERVLEQLPLSRDRFAVTARLAHRFAESTFRLDERVYSDTWGLIASTTDARYVMDFGRRLALGPHARFHTQTPVSFWQLAYVSNFTPKGWNVPEYRTGARELGPLHGLTGGADLRIAIGPDANPTSWILGLVGECIWTSYTDDLYITDRVSGFGALSVEATFE